MWAAAPAQVRRVRTSQACPAGQDEGAGHVRSVLVQRAAPERDVVAAGPAPRRPSPWSACWSCPGRDRVRTPSWAEGRSWPRRAPARRPVPCPRWPACTRRTGWRDGPWRRPATGATSIVRVGGIEHADGAGVDHGCHPIPSLADLLEHDHRAHHVHLGAQHRVGTAERHLERREVDDVGDAVRVEGAPERITVGDVAGRERDPRQLLVREQHAQPARIAGPVEGHDRRRPRERAGGPSTRRCSPSPP